MGQANRRGDQSAEERDRAWYREHFPDAAAREAADRAVDAMPIDSTLQQCLDGWVVAYKTAGGKTDYAATIL